ncbi:MAG: sulfotransferase [Pseudomonadota bacterium]
MAHPLSGANIGTLARVAQLSGAPEKRLSAVGVWGAALGRWPASTLERLSLIGRLPATAEMAPPVFILGHWRSGTTHLYNIMCKSEEWAYVPPVATGLPWDLFGLAKLTRPILEKQLPEHRFIDNIPVRPDSPQEDEIAIANMTSVSFYHGIYFPKAFDKHLARGLFFEGCRPVEIEEWKHRFVHLMKKLSKLQEGKPLLIKNPVYTGRLAMLREIFPHAKFVHIERNPYEVFTSMRNFYEKLFAEFALQDYSHVDIDERILQVYERMMLRLERDAEGLPENVYLDVRYEDLDAKPLETVERIYETLELPGFERARGRFVDYLSAVKTFKKNTFAYTDEAAAKVEGRLGRFVERGGYMRPGTKG